MTGCGELQYIPKKWKESTTTMIYKGKGDKTDPLNYRPIALLSCVYKVYSQIITNRIQKWVEDNNLLNANQHGFRKGHDTSNGAAEIFNIINNAIRADKEIHMILLDIAKAYDSVEFWALVKTLMAYGMGKGDLKLIEAMIKGNKTQIITAHGLTEDIEEVRKGNEAIDKLVGENRGSIDDLTAEDIRNEYYIVDKQGKIIDGNHKKFIYNAEMCKIEDNWSKRHQNTLNSTGKQATVVAGLAQKYCMET